MSSVYQHQGQDTLHSNQTDISLTLGPRARRYLAQTGPVRPFAETGIDLGANYLRVHTSDGVGTTRWGLLAGLDAGAGAEWFPTRRVSLAASTGFALSFQRDHANNGGPTEWSIGLRTFTSALTGQFYF